MSVRALSVLLALPLMALAHGQTLGAVAVANRAVTATITPTGGVPMTASAPAGTPVANLVSLAGRSSFLLIAQVWGGLTVDRAFVELALNDVSFSGGVGTAATDAEVLLTLQPSAPVAVDVQLEWDLTGTAGQPLPLVEADVGNTGFFVRASRPGAVQRLGTLVLGATPFGIRLHVQSASSGGQQVDNVRLRVVPSPQRLLREFSASCGVAVLTAETAFDQSLLFRATPAGALLQYLVVGLSLAPQPLPGRPNCQLMPATDAVAVLGSQGVSVPPPAVPVGGFYAQVVQVYFSGATGSNTIQVR